MDDFYAPRQVVKNPIKINEDLALKKSNPEHGVS